jgi:hypothetical protein
MEWQHAGTSQLHPVTLAVEQRCQALGGSTVRLTGRVPTRTGQQSSERYANNREGNDTSGTGRTLTGRSYQVKTSTIDLSVCDEV